MAGGLREKPLGTMDYVTGSPGMMDRSSFPVNYNLIKFDRTVWSENHFWLWLLMNIRLENERMVFF